MEREEEEEGEEEEAASSAEDESDRDKEEGGGVDPVFRLEVRNALGAAAMHSDKVCVSSPHCCPPSQLSPSSSSGIWE